MSVKRSTKPIVLIVEDDPLLRIDAVEIIRDAGFDTLEAANAQEAIDILNGRSDIRIVFTDVNMPGTIDGLKLAKAIRERWPPVDLIITSGQILPAAHEIPPRGHFIAKPYEPGKLVEALRSFAP